MAKPKVKDVLNLLSGKSFDECNKLLDRIEQMCSEDDLDQDDSPEDGAADDANDSSEDNAADAADAADDADDSSEDDAADDVQKSLNEIKLEKENASLKNQIKKLQEKNRHQPLDDGDENKTLQERQNDIIQKMFG